jgi:hypothetical protein
MLSRIAVKRARAEYDDDDDDDDDVSNNTKRRRNDKDRGERRKHVVAQVLALDSSTFKKMFRMDKQSLLLLHSKISIILDEGVTPRNVAMAQVIPRPPQPISPQRYFYLPQISSRSHVNSLLLLFCTIRWLAGDQFHVFSRDRLNLMV